MRSAIVSPESNPGVKIPLKRRRKVLDEAVVEMDSSEPLLASLTSDVGTA